MSFLETALPSVFESWNCSLKEMMASRIMFTSDQYPPALNISMSVNNSHALPIIDHDFLQIPLTEQKCEHSIHGYSVSYEYTYFMAREGSSYHGRDCH